MDTRPDVIVPGTKQSEKFELRFGEWNRARELSHFAFSKLPLRRASEVITGSEKGEAEESGKHF